MRYVFDSTGPIQAELTRNKVLIGFVEEDGSITLAAEWEVRRPNITRTLVRSVKENLRAGKFLATRHKLAMSKEERS